MKRLRFTEEQIIGVLREQEAGAKNCRKHGISDATFYKWKAKYGGLDTVSGCLAEHLPGREAPLCHDVPRGFGATQRK